MLHWDTRGERYSAARYGLCSLHFIERIHLDLLEHNVFVFVDKVTITLRSSNFARKHIPKIEQRQNKSIVCGSDRVAAGSHYTLIDSHWDGSLDLRVPAL